MKNCLSLRDKRLIEYVQVLLERIHNVDTTRRPPLGENPFSGSVPDLVASLKAAEEAKYLSASLSGKIRFACSNNNGNYTIGTGDYAFHLRQYTVSNTAAHTRASNLGFRQNHESVPSSLDDIKQYDFSSTDRRISKGDSVVVVNKKGKVAALKLLSCGNRSHGAVEDEVEFEYTIIPEVSVSIRQDSAL